MGAVSDLVERAKAYRILPWWCAFLLWLFLLVKVLLVYNASPCSVLGVESPVTKSDVSKAYRSLSLCTHPDRLTSALKRQPTPPEVARATALFDKFTQARDHLNEVIRHEAARGNTETNCYNLELEGFLLQGIQYVWGQLVANLSPWALWDFVTGFYHYMGADGWSMEDVFILLLLFTVGKLLWRFLMWSLSFGWRGPFMFFFTFAIGPLPTLVNFLALPFVRLYALAVDPAKESKVAPSDAAADGANKDKDNDPGKDGKEKDKDKDLRRRKVDSDQSAAARRAEQIQAARGPTAVKQQQQLKQRAVMEQRLVDGLGVPGAALPRDQMSLLELVQIQPSAEQLQDSGHGSNIAPERNKLAGAIQFDILIVFTKPIIPLLMLICVGQVFDGSIAYFVIGWAVSKLPRLSYEGLHIILVVFGVLHTVLGVRGDIVKQAGTKEVLTLMWGFTLKDIMALGDLILAGATYSAGVPIGNDPFLTTSFASGIALRIVVHMIPWMPGSDFVERKLMEYFNFGVKFENSREVVMPSGGVGDCGGGVLRSLFGATGGYYAGLVLKFGMLLVILHSTLQWALRVKQMKRTPRTRRRMLQRCVLAVAGLAQVYLLYALNLNTAQGSLVNLWVAAVTSGLAESLLSAYDVRGDVRRCAVLLLFLLST